ncbi:MAG TPA: hypothetical protein ACFYD4_08150 [Candidatus Wunengus sp. YC61]|uniref:hypothetical protein n=1 Tax=Candidatus Wunengus sp. YC61 TaxID=3367698 RepID=UPI00402675FE
MIDKTRNRIIAFMVVILALFLAIAIVNLLKSCVAISQKPITIQPTEAEKVGINRLFTKHGNWWARVDKEVTVFWRDGQWCNFQ